MSKLVYILACGETGAQMPDDACAHVIGVNDAGKFDKRINELFFLNRPRHFNEPAGYRACSRLDVITHTQVERVVTLEALSREWRSYFLDKVHTVSVTRWSKTFHKDQVYHTDNSPFSAMCYAVTIGATDVVLYGVDLNNHRYLKAINSAPAFSQYAVAARKIGVNIYKAHTDQNLNLPLWTDTLQ
jgi:hypothetical protein